MKIHELFEDFNTSNNILSKDETKDRIDDQERKRNLENFLRGNDPSVPNILYHGSRSETDFDTFKPSWGTYGQGIYLTDKQNVAGDFAMGIRAGETTPKMGGRIIPLYVSMKKPFTDEYLRNDAWRDYIKDIIENSFKKLSYRKAEYTPIKEYIIGKLDNGKATVRDLFVGKIGSYDHDQVLQELGCNEIIETIHRSGFDGIIVKRPDGSIEYVVFKPEQVKSVIGNVGTFDPHKPNINEEE